MNCQYCFVNQAYLYGNKLPIKKNNDRKAALFYLSIEIIISNFETNTKMRVEKENEFNSFSKLLTKIDATNLGDHELKLLKK